MQYTTFKNTGMKLFFSMAIALMATFAVNAQRVASVDVNKILESISEYQSAQTELDNLAAQWRQDIAQEYDVIKGLYNRYQAEQVLMSDEKRRQSEEEIMQKETEVRELQKAKFGPEGALFQKRKDLVQPIQEKVYSAIENYATQRGYDFIFDKAGSAGLIYSNAKYDVTEDILKSLSK